MLTLIAAAALAAQAPAAPSAPAHQMPMMQMNQSGEQDQMKTAMDCCKEHCKDMAKGRDSEAAGHADHKDR
jgi:hypothetical protein